MTSVVPKTLAETSRALAPATFRAASEHLFRASQATFFQIPAQAPSNAIALRRVEDFVPSASFVWYSGNTLKNGRGSLMVYNIGADKPVCWFAAFGRKSGWALERTKGIEKEQVSRLLVGV